MANPHRTAARGLRSFTVALFRVKLLKHILVHLEVHLHMYHTEMIKHSGRQRRRKRPEREKQKKEVEGVKAMLRQITLNELAALSEQDSFLNKT